MAGRPQPVSMRVTPFRIDVPDAVLADLAVRLDRTRLADEVDDGDWNRGMHRGYLASLRALLAPPVRLAGAGSRPQPSTARTGRARRPRRPCHPRAGPRAEPASVDSHARLSGLVHPLPQPDPASHRSGRARRRRRGCLRRRRAELAGLWVLRPPDEVRHHLPDRRAVAHADDRRPRLPPLRRARRRLGQHRHRAARAQSRRRGGRHPPHRRPVLAPVSEAVRSVGGGAARTSPTPRRGSRTTAPTP